MVDLYRRAEGLSTDNSEEFPKSPGLIPGGVDWVGYRQFSRSHRFNSLGQISNMESHIAS
jgi:hypothetical protein